MCNQGFDVFKIILQVNAQVILKFQVIYNLELQSQITISNYDLEYQVQSQNCDLEYQLHLKYNLYIKYKSQIQYKYQVTTSQIQITASLMLFDHGGRMP